MRMSDDQFEKALVWAKRVFVGRNADNLPVTIHSEEATLDFPSWLVVTEMQAQQLVKAEATDIRGAGRLAPA